jgi:ribonuclease-3
MSAPLEELEARLGHAFRDRELLLRALTHRSFSQNPLESPSSDNEQLEFLGDSVLGLLVSDALLARCPDFPEGKLSRLKAHLVSARHLHTVALALGLGEFLRLGKGEESSGGRQKRMLLANAVEAILGAIYLEGGLDPCRRLLEQYILRGISLDEMGATPVPGDPKCELQEFAQARKLPAPRYVVIEERGPDHSKVFIVEARLGKQAAASAAGSSKKAASQEAAALLLARLRQEEEGTVRLD